jgi:LCP family protein required for cell wall assembly
MTSFDTRVETAERDGPSVPGHRPARHARKRRRILLLLVGLPVGLALLLATGAATGVWWVQRSVDSKIERFGNPFNQIPESARPAAAPASSAGAGAVNLLVLGSDSRISAGDPRQWQAGAQRTDAIMLVHVPADRSGAFVTSIPRDSWVNVPGHGMAKINAAFSWGGPALTIRTVESVTGVRVDHIVITDFDGFARITDLLGGVTVTVPTATHDERAAFPAGTYTMNGNTALTYVRQRHNLPGGDFDREKRQQNWMRAILRGAIASGAQTDPAKLLSLLNAGASSLATDDQFTIGQMRDLAWSLRHVGSGGVRFLTTPVAGTGWSPDHQQQVVFLDTTKAAALWSSVRGDHVASWVTTAGYPVLGEAVR